MTRNTLEDLNNHLFEILERLNDEDLTGDKLSTEIERSKAIATVAAQIVKNGNLALNAHRYTTDSIDANSKANAPKMLGLKHGG